VLGLLALGALQARSRVLKPRTFLPTGAGTWVLACLPLLFLLAVLVKLSILQNFQFFQVFSRHLSHF
jgi:hypothetical protein